MESHTVPYCLPSFAFYDTAIRLRFQSSSIHNSNSDVPDMTPPTQSNHNRETSTPHSTLSPLLSPPESIHLPDEFFFISNSASRCCHLQTSSGNACSRAVPTSVVSQMHQDQLRRVGVGRGDEEEGGGGVCPKSRCSGKLERKEKGKLPTAGRQGGWRS